MPGEKRCVCFGSSVLTADAPAAQLARDCGRALAGLGWTVVTGGYEGAMGAVSRGAREAGGRVIGVTTPIFTERVPNEALTAEWTEPDYLTRMSTLLRQGHAFVGLPGGLGTLSECVAAVCLASIGQLGGPVLLFRDPWQPVFRELESVPEIGHEIGALVRWIDRAGDLQSALGPV
jgi:uncharacterized protein (TIGR00730 family)